MKKNIFIQKVQVNMRSCLPSYPKLKNLDEIEEWRSKIGNFCMEEYWKCDQKYYDIEEVGRRFLDPIFLDDGTFPLLNDGGPELYE